MKAGRAVLLSIVVMIVVGATPASASPVLAEAKPWHYWMSFVLMASFLGLALLLVLGYVVRVVMAKYGIRVGRRSAG